VIRPMMSINVTADHRYIDGLEGGLLSRVVAQFFESPDDIDMSSQDITDKIREINGGGKKS